MSIQTRIRKHNLLPKLLAVVTVSSIALHSFAAPDYERMRKDINIMIGIVKSAFENDEDCNSCQVQITGHYLADQGVVFNVTPASRGYAYAFKTNDFEENVEVFAEGMAAIPLVVEDILASVEMGLANDSFSAITIDTDGDWSEQSRIARQALREARAELREANRELREIEIEAIHAEQEELNELEAREAEVLQEMERLASQEEKIQEDIASQVEAKRNEIEKKRAKRMEAKRQQFEDMETLVLNTFCDYSSTMRSLPRNERVSVIVSKGEDQSNIYVFEQSELADCDSSKTDVRDHALSYAF
jgi:hypothetical protein